MVLMRSLVCLILHVLACLRAGCAIACFLRADPFFTFIFSPPQQTPVTLARACSIAQLVLDWNVPGR